MKKKLIVNILLMIFLVSLFSIVAYAAFEGAFSAFESFFDGGWRTYEKTVAFVIFFFLFFSTFMIGMKNAFKELTRPHIIFALVASLLSSLIVISTMNFDWINLKYIAWGLISILLLFLIYFVFSKMFGEKNKFWAFFLALILAALLLGLIWYLYNEGMGFGGLGDFGNWFERLGKGEKWEPADDGLTPPGPKPTPTTPEDGGWPWGRIGGGGLGALLFAILIWAWMKRKKPEPTPTPAQPIPQPQPPIQPQVVIGGSIKKELEAALETKTTVSGHINELEKNKEEILKDTAKHASLLAIINDAGGMEKFFEEEWPRLRDVSDEDYEKLTGEEKNMKKLIEDNAKLFKYFTVLSETEEMLIRNSELIKTKIIEEFNLDPGEVERGMVVLLRVCNGVLVLLREIFLDEEEENAVGTEISRLLDDERIEERIKLRWVQAEKDSEGKIEKLLLHELHDYSKVRKLVEDQNKVIGVIIQGLEKAEVEKEEEKDKGGEGEDKGGEGKEKKKGPTIHIISPDRASVPEFKLGKQEVRLEADIEGTDDSKKYSAQWIIAKKDFRETKGDRIKLNKKFKLGSSLLIESVTIKGAEKLYGEKDLVLAAILCEVKKGRLLSEVIPLKDGEGREIVDDIPIKMNLEEKGEKPEIKIIEHNPRLLVGRKIGRLNANISGKRVKDTSKYDVEWVLATKRDKEIIGTGNPIDAKYVVEKKWYDYEEDKKIGLVAFLKYKGGNYVRNELGEPVLDQVSVSTEEFLVCISYTDPALNKRKRYVLRDDVTIGSGADNDIELSPYGNPQLNESISKNHLVIKKKNHKYYVGDRSENGTSIINGSGERVIKKKSIWLQNEDFIAPNVSEQDRFGFTIYFLDQVQIMERSFIDLPEKLVIMGPPKILSIEPKTGPITGGTKVTIKGIHFTEDMHFSIGSWEIEEKKFVDSETVEGRTGKVKRIVFEDETGEKKGLNSVYVYDEINHDSLEGAFLYFEEKPKIMGSLKPRNSILDNVLPDGVVYLDPHICEGEDWMWIGKKEGKIQLLDSNVEGVMGFIHYDSRLEEFKIQKTGDAEIRVDDKEVKNVSEVLKEDSNVKIGNYEFLFKKVKYSEKKVSQIEYPVELALPKTKMDVIEPKPSSKHSIGAPITKLLTEIRGYFGEEYNDEDNERVKKKYGFEWQIVDNERRKQVIFNYRRTKLNETSRVISNKFNPGKAWLIVRAFDMRGKPTVIYQEMVPIILEEDLRVRPPKDEKAERTKKWAKKKADEGTKGRKEKQLPKESTESMRRDKLIDLLKGLSRKQVKLIRANPIIREFVDRKNKNIRFDLSEAIKSIVGNEGVREQKNIFTEMNSTDFSEKLLNSVWEIEGIDQKIKMLNITLQTQVTKRINPIYPFIKEIGELFDRLANKKEFKDYISNVKYLESYLDDSDNNVLASISRSFVELKKKMSEEIVKILDELIDKNSRRLLIDESDDKFNWVVAHKQLLTVFDNEEGFTARFVNKNLNAILVHINNNLKWIMAREKKPKEAEPTSIDDLAEGTTEDETREYLDNQDDRIRQEEAERLDGTVIEHELNEALKKAGITREDLFKLPKKDFDENVAQFLKVKGLSAKFVDKFKGKISAMLNKKR